MKFVELFTYWQSSTKLSASFTKSIVVLCTLINEVFVFIIFFCLRWIVQHAIFIQIKNSSTEIYSKMQSELPREPSSLKHIYNLILTGLNQLF